MLVVQARFRYTQNPCVGFLLVAGWCFQHFVRNPAQVNTRSKSLTIKVMCWPQTWRRASYFGVLWEYLLSLLVREKKIDTRFLCLDGTLIKSFDFAERVSFSGK